MVMFNSYVKLPEGKTKMGVAATTHHFFYGTFHELNWLMMAGGFTVKSSQGPG